MQRGFVILDHPSDLGIEARGASLSEAFCEAAKGMMSVIVDSTSAGSEERRVIRLAGADREQLLVKWLSEILYLYDGERIVPEQFIIEELTTTQLAGEIRGTILSSGVHSAKLDVKAVTYHQLEIVSNSREHIVRVYLDI
jgi:SHS2 domain-containing protein